MKRIWWLLLRLVVVVTLGIGGAAAGVSPLSARSSSASPHKAHHVAATFIGDEDGLRRPATACQLGKANCCQQAALATRNDRPPVRALGRIAPLRSDAGAPRDPDGPASPPPRF